MTEKLVALDFSKDQLVGLFEMLFDKNIPFEIIGDGIIAFATDVAETIEKDQSFTTKRIPVISLESLPLNEAREIRRNHWFR